MKEIILVASSELPKDCFKELSNHANSFFIQDLSDDVLDRILPTVNCMIFNAWPSRLDSTRVEMMGNLKVIQSMKGGVDDIPFEHIQRNVRVYNTIGAYATEVAEHAIALLLSAAKSIVEFNLLLRTKVEDDAPLSGEFSIQTIKGKSLGIIGYGNIGKIVAKYAKGLGMKVFAFARHTQGKTTATVYLGRNGMRRILRTCDMILLALPLSETTRGIVSKEELAMLKDDAIMVNVGRGDTVDQVALYDKMLNNPRFIYATDVWWYKGKGETFSADLPFSSLSNFIATPHVSGPLATMSGRMPKIAIDNLLRYLNGKTPRNRVYHKEQD